jgi:hypothetical protein
MQQLISSCNDYVLAENYIFVHTLFPVSLFYSALNVFIVLTVWTVQMDVLLIQVFNIFRALCLVLNGIELSWMKPIQFATIRARHPLQSVH